MNGDEAITKRVWTDVDFEQMGWMDCHVHALAFASIEHELLIDLDYILEWQQPLPTEDFFRFLIAPATLVFQDVFRISWEGEILSSLEIKDIFRDETNVSSEAAIKYGKPFYNWTISCSQCDLVVLATGYTQYFRSVLHDYDTRVVSLTDRGGYSFAKGKVGV